MHHGDPMKEHLKAHMSDDMLDCIRMCWQSRAACQTVFFTHCLPHGGPHVAPDHVKLMTDCMEICQVAADFMTRDSALHAEICRACAVICDACADSCLEIGGAEMDRCADICRRCADSCRDMASDAPPPQKSRGAHTVHS